MFCDLQKHDFALSLAGDIVFLTSDGVFDNFSPFILKTARPLLPRTPPPGADYEFQQSSGQVATSGSNTVLPSMDPQQCHAKQMELMTLAVRGASGNDDSAEPSSSSATRSSLGPVSARELSERLLHCVEKVGVCVNTTLKHSSSISFISGD